MGRERLLIAVALAAGALPAWAADPPTPPPTSAPSPAATANALPAKPAAGAEQLNGVTVNGYRDLMLRSDRRLKSLQDSLPELDSNIARKKSIGERASDTTRNYLAAHRDPEKLSSDQKAFVERAMNGVDREHRSAVATPATTDAQDYADPLCQAGSCPP